MVLETALEWRHGGREMCRDRADRTGGGAFFNLMLGMH